MGPKMTAGKVLNGKYFPVQKLFSCQDWKEIGMLAKFLVASPRVNLCAALRKNVCQSQISSFSVPKIFWK